MQFHNATLVLVALLMGTTFGHALEMLAKMEVDGQLWMTFQQTLYPYFAYIGGPIELGAIIAAGILSLVVRHHPPSFYLALAAALCLAVAFFVVWLGFINFVNAETAKWTADWIPVDWARWRTQWEFSHVARFVLHLSGFSALVLSLIFVSPKEFSG